VVSDAAFCSKHEGMFSSRRMVTRNNFQLDCFSNGNISGTCGVHKLTKFRKYFFKKTMHIYSFHSTPITYKISCSNSLYFSCNKNKLVIFVFLVLFVSYEFKSKILYIIGLWWKEYV
jgi:hypothetical protein